MLHGQSILTILFMVQEQSQKKNTNFTLAFLYSITVDTTEI